MITTSLPTDAEALIRYLHLSHHPEGGYFRETFKDTTVLSNGRSASTAIYFLVLENHPTRWHKISSSEIWHWYGGSPLKLSWAAPGQMNSDVVLGFDIHNNMLPQHCIPAGCWQKALTLGAWTLAGCTVAPGFRFEDLVMAPPNRAPPFCD